MELVDNQSVGGADNLGESAQAQDTTQDLTQQTVEKQAIATQSPYQPFASGKEKFTVNGKEVEWDWETAKKYASLGNTAYQKMQEAADIKKRSEAAYSQLLELAQKDPETLIRALNPNYNPQSQQTQRQDQNVADVDPRDLKIQQLEQRLGKLDQLEKAYEEQQVEKERAAIAQELEQAETKYPILKGDKFAINFIKAEYRKALQSGLDVSLDDVAFHVSQELQDLRQTKAQQTQQRLEQKRKQAPVNVVASGAESAAKSMSLDDVKKLAGRF